jgi:effector-binding domain-containing protein
MNKKLRNFAFLGLAILGIWYFAIKQEHYQISFTTRQPAGIVYNQILEWKPTKENGISEIAVDHGTQYSEVVQQVRIGDSLFTYRWQFSKKNDSLTQVNVRITDEHNGLYQKMQVPFSDNDFVKRSVKNVAEVGNSMVLNAKKFRVHTIKDTVFLGGFCAYLPLESPVDKKAATMLYSIADLMGYVKENELELQGDPYLEVVDWDQKTSMIRYNFCFPLLQSDSLPASNKILFKETPSFKAIKAEFNGNYSISDNAWYYLLEYAEQNQLKVKSLPVELYLNDPHTSGTPLHWKANIYLPLVD